MAVLKCRRVRTLFYTIASLESGTTAQELFVISRPRTLYRTSPTSDHHQAQPHLSKPSALLCGCLSIALHCSHVGTFCT